MTPSTQPREGNQPTNQSCTSRRTTLLFTNWEGGRRETNEELRLKRRKHGGVDDEQTRKYKQQRERQPKISKNASPIKRIYIDLSKYDRYLRQSVSLNRSTWYLYAMVFGGVLTHKKITRVKVNSSGVAFERGDSNLARCRSTDLSELRK